MIRRKSLFQFLCVGILFVGGAGRFLPAQPVLQSDVDWPRGQAMDRPLPGILRGNVPDTLQVSAATPFFDDFSWGGMEPDSQWWFTGPSLIDVPNLHRQHALQPPSWGVATFDGNNRRGTPYNTGALSTGPADRLFSHYLDLSNSSPGNNWVLSFFLQPQGLGEKPEASDSFYVFFRTPNPPPNDFQKVLAIGGSAIEPFGIYTIPLDDPAFFHQGFQLLFESRGSQNGALDEWQLDYVTLAPNRNLNDTTFADQSPTALLRSPMAPYTAIPLQHYLYQPDVMTPFSVEVSNLSPNQAPVSVRAELSEPVDNTPLVPIFTQSNSVTVGPTTHAERAFSAFTDQPLADLAALEMEVRVTGNQDEFPENDAFRVRYPIDSIFAYDDGEADAGFGLNQSLGFGVRFDLEEEDSVSAVWMSFQPRIHYNPVDGTVTYMSEQTFRLVIWDDPNPDSILHVQLGGIKIQYGDEPNHFERFAIGSPVPVPKTFWVGVQQINSKPLGIGYDLNTDQDARTYWDSSGVWTNTRLGGALMIRPEMVNLYAVPTSQADKQSLTPRVKSFPNPLHGRQLSLLLPPAWQGRNYSCELLDGQGRLIWRSKTLLAYPGQTVLELPEGLSPGLYWLRHHGPLDDFPQTEKIQIN